MTNSDNCATFFRRTHGKSRSRARAARGALIRTRPAASIPPAKTMRIIAGFHRGRKFDAPEGLTTRPMTDRVRENLFNLLGPAVVDAVALDLFCGSGALGMESLSRGAAWCTFVDDDRAAIEVVETNCRRLGLEERAKIVRHDALRAGPWIGPPRGGGYSLIFVDPPYKMTAEPDGRRGLAEMMGKLDRLHCIAPGATAMLRVERGTQHELPWPGFDLYDARSYGSTTLYLMTYKS